MATSNEELAVSLSVMATDAEERADDVDGYNQGLSNLMRIRAKKLDVSAARIRAIDGLVEAIRKLIAANCIAFHDGDVNDAIQSQLAGAAEFALEKLSAYRKATGEE